MNVNNYFKVFLLIDTFAAQLFVIVVIGLMRLTMISYCVADLRLIRRMLPCARPADPGV